MKYFMVFAINQPLRIFGWNAFVNINGNNKLELKITNRKIKWTETISCGKLCGKLQFKRPKK